MFTVIFLSSLAALLLVYICIPAVWFALMAGDDTLDAHESGLMLVASRAPFRETGPPANMAKLILLRHKVGNPPHKDNDCGLKQKLSPDPNKQQETTQLLAFTPGVTKLHGRSATTQKSLDALWQTLCWETPPLNPRHLLH
ncbi:hypothetical protein CC1G_14671 [Coprinopsis cinerea okayama7|uniref:Uncharacterized protein n=1 Tax=Coprinopsis cinerea (strain Okayama-7 / 130 / ATCC MYA-4618 / FGSC 9003) TaxID=240176 RepID=D6RMS7_COPC7|nr:hypothetical protein CC1G_14671 [Coprinopsis cinerea okayama7\|eukprot:XP_002911242.1 hypothetical protein CC1G_14671 [Coprinopsis cinerea okayama7\